MKQETIIKRMTLMIKICDNYEEFKDKTYFYKRKYWK